LEKGSIIFNQKIPQIQGGKSNGTVTPVEKFPKLSVYLQGCSLFWNSPENAVPFIA